MSIQEGSRLTIRNSERETPNSLQAIECQPSTHLDPKKAPRLFVHTTFPAPYRVAVFDRLESRFDVFVAYEDKRDPAHDRDAHWYTQNLGPNAVIASSREGAPVYRRAITNLQSFDAVMVYEYSSTMAMRLMLRCLRQGVPYLINADGAFINRNPIKTALKRFFISHASACLAGSASAENYFREYGARSTNIFRHEFSNLEDADVRESVPTAHEKFAIRRKLALPAEGVIFLAVGQFIHRKGFDILLQAWSRVDMTATLVIMGGGPEEHRYREIIEKDGLQNVFVKGFGPKEFVFDHYLASDCFVLPTREDVWGLVINEAMACGLPVITTNRCVAGMELIEQRINGFVVDTEDPAALDRAMSEIATDPALRLAMASANVAKISSHTIEKVVESHANTLKRVLAR